MYIPVGQLPTALREALRLDQSLSVDACDHSRDSLLETELSSQEGRDLSWERGLGGGRCIRYFCGAWCEHSGHEAVDSLLGAPSSRPE